MPLDAQLKISIKTAHRSHVCSDVYLQHCASSSFDLPDVCSITEIERTHTSSSVAPCLRKLQ